jgi:predicted MFS family arabinose efflux permease
MGTGAGLYQYVSSLFVKELQSTFGWTRGAIATATAVGLLGAVSAPFIGGLSDRIGVRRVAMGGVGLLTVAFLIMAGMRGSYLQYIVASAIIGTVAPGCTALVYSRAVNGAFYASKGLALGVMAAGLSAFTLTVSPIVSWAIRTHGYQWGYAVLAICSGAIGLPVVALVLRRLPETPVGADAGSSRSLQAVPWKHALRHRAFWLLALAMLLVNAPSSGVLTQLAPLLDDQGLNADAAARYIALFSVSVLIGRVIVGWLFDRADARKVAAAFAIGGVLACLLLLRSVPDATLTIGVVLIGLLQGAEIDVLAYFVASNFGTANYGAIYGPLVTVSLLGTALGVLGFGRLYDATRSYGVSLILGAAMLVVVAIAYLLLPRTARSAG